MAELKHTFVSGRMDKDRDERLVENGSYRDALNIQVSSSEGSDVGAVENLLGNKKISDLNLKNAVVLGSIAYTLKDKIYWIVTSDNIDGIYEYDEKQNVVLPIIIDTKVVGNTTLKGVTVEANNENELTLDDVNADELKALCGNVPLNNNDEVLINNNLSLSSSNPFIKVTIPKNTTLRKEENKFVFKNIEYNGQDLGNVTLPFTYTSGGILNFSKNNLITGINIIDDLLFWTDNLNAPRKINIANFKKFSNKIFNAQTKVTFSEKDSNGNIIKKEREFTEEDLSVAKKAPMYAPTLALSETLIDGVSEINEPALSFALNGQPLDIGDDITISVTSEIPWELNAEVTIEENNNPDNTKEDLDVVAFVKSKTTNSITLTLKSKNIIFETSRNYDVTITLLESKPIYELTFVRFSYRWKYRDGEYSTIAPFSEVAFIPNDGFEYDGKKGFNTAMENNLRKIILSDFDLGTDNVEEIEILFKETRNQNVYTLKSEKKIDFAGTYEITKKQIHSVLPNDQLLRAWDNVPKKAKAQEITANRIIYGNYTQNYDIYNDPTFDIKLNQRNDKSKHSIKSDRTYQIGVVYIDEYNRHSPVISSQSGSIKVNKDKCANESAFNIAVTSTPPAWAKYYKYYIKDISKEYYNLAADRIYTDKENGFSYIAFPSSERNKITNETYLVLKKEHGSDEPVIDIRNRYKVIEIFNEAPDFVAFRKNLQTTFQDIKFDEALGDGTTDDGGTITGATEGKTPVKDNLKILIEKLDNNTAGISDEAKAFLKPGNYIKFTVDIDKTQFYEIASVRFKTNSPGNLTTGEIVFKTSFTDDVNALYDTDSNKTLKPNIGMEVYKTEGSKGDKEFDGKFFVKVEDNELLKDNSKQLVGGKNYAIKEVLELDGSPGIRKGLRFRNKALDSPKEPIFITQPSKNFDATKYAFDIEETSNTQSNEFIDLFKTGAVVKINDIDTPVKLLVGNERLLDNVKPTNKRKGNITQKSVGFRTLDDNKYTIASFLIPKPGDKEKTLTISFLQEINDNEVLSPSNPAIFETEPVENITDLDLYYETEKAFDIADHGNAKTLKWFNCFSFGNGVESNRIRDDFNAPFIDVGVKASSVISEQFKEEHRFNGLIWSGIINSRSGINRSNEFNIANPITKDLLPSYGSIQKLHAWDDSIVILCEDKIIRALADKDILFNADGNPNIVATNKVIGATQPYNGEYGISQNPESFASYGFRCYFADKTRGAVLRLSKDGLTPINKILMADFFNDRFFDTGCFNSTVDNSYFIGSYDDYNSLYNLSFIGRDTVCFDEAANGWPTRKSFIPQFGISLNNRYYTYNTGEMWLHDNDTVPYNNFYGQQYNSKIILEINDDPSVIKSYKTLGYEGTTGWTANIVTDQQKSSTITFKEKENKYFAFVNGEAKSVDNIDPKNFNFQGIGTATSISSVSAISNTTLTFELSPIETDKYNSNRISVTGAPGSKLNDTVELKVFAKSGYSLNANNFNLKNVVATQDGDNVKLAYTHGIKTQPTRNTSKLIELCKIDFAAKKDITISGNYTVNLTNVTSTVNNGSYSFSGNEKVIKTIVTRVITPDDGWQIVPAYISVNNPLIRLTKSKNSDGSITLTEKISIPSTTTVANYEISAFAVEKPIQKKSISSISIDKSNITAKNFDRILSVYGDPGATFSYKLSDTSAEIESERNIEIPPTGLYEKDIEFPLADTSETFNINISPGNESELAPAISTGSTAIARPAVVTKTVTLFSQFGSTVSNKVKAQAFLNSNVANSFTQVITLPTATYTVLRQPTPSDFIFDNTLDSTVLSNLKMVFNQGNHTVTLTGDIAIDDITTDNKIVLILDKIINNQVVLTIEYNNTILGGAATTNYTDSADFTITGAAGLLAPALKEYLFTLTPSSGFEFIPTVNGADFEITDGSNVVTSTYALNDKIKVVLDNNLLKVGFLSKDFNLPVANKTISVRPKKQIAQSVNIVPNYSILYEFTDPSDEKFTTSKLQGTLTNSANQNFLFQKTFILDRNDINCYQYIFTTTGHVINLKDAELSAATAGTYTDINGNSVTVAGQIELNDARTELTVNTLANINSVPAKQLGKIEVDLKTQYFGTGYFGRYFISLTKGGCDTTGRAIAGRLYPIDPLRKTPAVGDYVTDRLGFQRFSIGSHLLENTYKVNGANLVITLVSNSTDRRRGIERIKSVEQCPPPKDVTFNMNDIVKTFGDPNFALNITSNSSAAVSISIANSSIATISGNIVTIVGAGDTIITASTPEVPGKFNAGLQTAKLKVRKADPVLTITDQNKFSDDPDFTITTS